MSNAKLTKSEIKTLKLRISSLESFLAEETNEVARRELTLGIEEAKAKLGAAA